jgi:hypothetical protein
MAVSVQLHVPAALSLRKSPPVRLRYSTWDSKEPRKYQSQYSVTWPRFDRVSSRIFLIQTLQTPMLHYQHCRQDVGFYFLTAVVVKSSILWDIMPCSPLKANQRFGGTCPLRLLNLLATCFMLVSSLPYSSTLKIEAACSSETSVLTFDRLRGVISQKL